MLINIIISGAIFYYLMTLHANDSFISLVFGFFIYAAIALFGGAFITEYILGISIDPPWSSTVEDEHHDN